jgi:hypothetical protein
MGVEDEHDGTQKGKSGWEWCECSGAMGEKKALRISPEGFIETVSSIRV